MYEMLWLQDLASLLLFTQAFQKQKEMTTFLTTHHLCKERSSLIKALKNNNRLAVKSYNFVLQWRQKTARYSDLSGYNKHKKLHREHMAQ